MNLHLVNTTHSETVKLPISLKTGKHPLYGRASAVDILPLSVFWIRSWANYRTIAAVRLTRLESWSTVDYAQTFDDA